MIKFLYFNIKSFFTLFLASIFPYYMGLSAEPINLILNDGQGLQRPAKSTTTSEGYTEFTSIDELTENYFIMANDDDGTWMSPYWTTANAQNAMTGTSAAVCGGETNFYLFKAEAVTYNNETYYRIGIYNADKTFFKGVSSGGYLNSAGWVFFSGVSEESGLTYVYGTDFNGGGIWDITYVEGSGFQFQCVGNGYYISKDFSNSSAADTYYWQCFADGTFYEASETFKSTRMYQDYEALSEELAELAKNITDFSADDSDRETLTDAITAAAALVASVSSFDEIEEAIDNLREAAHTFLNAATKLTTDGVNVTFLIGNQSFETGSISPWTNGTSSGRDYDVGVKANSSYYVTTNTDGDYLFNTYTTSEDWVEYAQNQYVEQTISNVPAGEYKLIALSASNTYSYGINTPIDLYGNDYYESFVPQSSSTFKQDYEAKVYVFPTDAELIIGMRSASWFKADNFRLTYYGETASYLKRLNGEEGEEVNHDAVETYKSASSDNPISAAVFCADPTAMEYNGRVYVYGSNEHQSYLIGGETSSNDYINIKSIVVFSSEDMVNWTFHGTIDVATVCSSWGSSFSCSWAPSVVWREGSDGSDEFFLYFANNASNIGVLTASSPLGPWESPLNKAMIDTNTAGVSPCYWCFDPGVAIDEDGTGWIVFGGGSAQDTGSELFPGNSRIAKLTSDMTAVDGAAVSTPAPFHFEANELNVMDGKLVLSYCSSWSDRSDYWSDYSGSNGHDAPSICSMCYMVSDNPLSSDSWKYKGEFLKNPGNFGFDWGNNHTHLQSFGDDYYLFYHSQVLEQDMGTGSSGYRSIGVTKLTVDEESQEISTASMSRVGVKAVCNLNPYERQQAETMATSGGVYYQHFTNVTDASSINTLGNESSVNMQISMDTGTWTMVRNADFGDEGATSFTLTASGTGTLEIRLNSETSATVATVDFSSNTLEEFVIKVDENVFTGVNDVYFIFTEASEVQFDCWQFANSQTGISITTTPETISNPQDDIIYNLSGIQIQNVQKGVYIKNDKKFIVR